MGEVLPFRQVDGTGAHHKIPSTINQHLLVQAVGTKELVHSAVALCVTPWNKLQLNKNEFLRMRRWVRM